MEDVFTGLLAVLATVIGYFIGQRLQHKSKTLHEQMKYYEQELGNMRTEVKRYRARASYFQKGAVTAEIADAGSPEALIEAVLSALPPNFRSMVQPFKASILQHAKENPELVKSITDAVKNKITGPNRQGEENAQQIDAL